jgi:hypothetical protein
MKNIYSKQSISYKYYKRPMFFDQDLESIVIETEIPMIKVKVTEKNNKVIDEVEKKIANSLRIVLVSRREYDTK